MASIFEKIQAFNAGRLPDMVKRKYTLMSANPFSFFRATSSLFYEDFKKNFQATDNTKIWSCADLHLQNFGTYRAMNRLVYFDLNDFDDAVLLPATFDLARMSTSINLAAENQKWDQSTVQKLVSSFLTTYRLTLEGGKSKDVDHRESEGEMRSLIKKLEKRDNKAFVQSFLDKTGKKLRIDNKKILPVASKRADEITEQVGAYFSKQHTSFFKKVRDIQFRAAGTSSLGLERYIMLIETEGKSDERFLLLDIKEARPSAALPFTNISQPTWASEADRIVSIQSYINDVLPALFSAITIGNKSFVIREMQAEEDKFDVTAPIKNDRFQTILSEMAIVTASGHLRSTGRRGSSITDELIAFSQQKDWIRQVLFYSKNYVSKVHTDFDEFIKSIKQNTPSV